MFQIQNELEKPLVDERVGWTVGINYLKKKYFVELFLENLVYSRDIRN